MQSTTFHEHPNTAAKWAGRPCPPDFCAQMSVRPERSEGSDGRASSGLTLHSVKPFDKLRVNGDMQPIDWQGAWIPTYCHLGEGQGGTTKE